MNKYKEAYEVIKNENELLYSKLLTGLTTRATIRRLQPAYKTALEALELIPKYEDRIKELEDFINDEPNRYKSSVEYEYAHGGFCDE